MSLYINGTKVIEGKFIDGKSTLPSISFITDPDSGFYRIGANNIGLALGGVKLVDWTSTLQTLTRSSLGTTTDSVLYLTTSTAAAAGAQQVSPSIQLRGYGWKTDATAESQPVDFQQFVVPEQGTSAPTGYIRWQSRINNGSWTNLMTLGNTGSLILTGNFIVNNAVRSTATARLDMAGSIADGGSAIANRIGNANSLTTAGAKIVSFYSDLWSTEKSYIDYRGAYSQSSALALGTTTIPMLTLANTTAAAAGAQQVSPSILLSGNGWKTDATAGSQPVDLQMYCSPAQGTSAPSGQFVLQYRVNNGAWATMMSCTSAGTLSASTYTPLSSTSNQFRGAIADGGSAIAHKFGNVNSLTTSGAKIASFYSDAFSTEKAYIGYDGEIYSAVGASLNTLTLRATTSGLILGNGVNTGVIYANTSYNQLLLGAGADGGRQWVITDSANRTKDHDHATQTNPTLFVHSVTDPDSANTEWISLTHDVTDAVIDAGKGNIKVNQNIAPQKRLLGMQGADVASANDITLGDGNYFDITGTTEVQRILGTGWTAGSIITLQFDASVNIKHGTAAGSDYYGLQLAEGADFAATAGDTLMLVFDGAWWREISRTAI